MTVTPGGQKGQTITLDKIYLVYSELVSEMLLPLVTSGSPLDQAHPINIIEVQIVFP